MAKCTRFTQLWTNQPDHRTSAAACTDAHVLGSDRGITVWRPQAPIGYAILGDCITDGGSQPTFQVCICPWTFCHISMQGKVTTSPYLA